MAEFKLKKGQKIYHIREFSSVLELARRKLISPDDALYVPLLDRWVFARAVHELRPFLPTAASTEEEALELPLEFVEPLTEDVGGLTVEISMDALEIDLTPADIRPLDPVQPARTPSSPRQALNLPPAQPPAMAEPFVPGHSIPEAIRAWIEEGPTDPGLGKKATAAPVPPPDAALKGIPPLEFDRPARRVTPLDFDPLGGPAPHRPEPTPPLIRPLDFSRGQDPVRTSGGGVLPDWPGPGPRGDGLTRNSGPGFDVSGGRNGRGDGPRTTGGEKTPPRGLNGNGRPLDGQRAEGARQREVTPPRGMAPRGEGLRPAEVTPTRGMAPRGPVNGALRETPLMTEGYRQPEVTPGRGMMPRGEAGRLAESANRPRVAGMDVPRAGRRGTTNPGVLAEELVGRVGLEGREGELADSSLGTSEEAERARARVRGRPGPGQGPVSFQTWMDDQARKAGLPAGREEFNAVLTGKLTEKPGPGSRFSVLRILVVLVPLLIVGGLGAWYVRTTAELFSDEPRASTPAPMAALGAPVPVRSVPTAGGAQVDDTRLRELIRPQVNALPTFDKAQDELFSELLNLRVGVADVKLEPLEGDRSRSVRTSESTLTVQLKGGRLSSDEQTVLVGLVVGKYVSRKKANIRSLVLEFDGTGGEAQTRLIPGQLAAEYFTRLKGLDQFMGGIQRDAAGLQRVPPVMPPAQASVPSVALTPAPSVAPLAVPAGSPTPQPSPEP